MVRTNNILNRSAFTMIELIFAIVVIAISVMSLPMVTQVTSRGMENNFAQEAIFLASAELNQALSYKWNGNSQENFGQLSKVVFAPIGYTTCDLTTKLRPGHVHRMCLNDTNLNTANLTLGLAADDNQSDWSINDSAVSDFNITTGVGAATGYKDDYTMDIDVDFAEFGDVIQAEHNIKEIKITVKQNGSDYVVLKTYSANIGETEAFKRVF